jgi:hypothetical protein
MPSASGVAMRILVDLRDPRLSPTERLVLGNLADKIRPAPRPVPPAHRESIDECLGEEKKHAR